MLGVQSAMNNWEAFWKIQTYLTDLKVTSLLWCLLWPAKGEDDLLYMAYISYH